MQTNKTDETGTQSITYQVPQLLPNQQASMGIINPNEENFKQQNIKKGTPMNLLEWILLILNSFQLSFALFNIQVLLFDPQNSYIDNNNDDILAGYLVFLIKPFIFQIILVMYILLRQKSVYSMAFLVVLSSLSLFSTVFSIIGFFLSDQSQQDFLIQFNHWLILIIVFQIVPGMLSLAQTIFTFKKRNFFISKDFDKMTIFSVMSLGFVMGFGYMFGFSMIDSQHLPRYTTLNLFPAILGIILAIPIGIVGFIGIKQHRKKFMIIFLIFVYPCLIFNFIVILRSQGYCKLYEPYSGMQSCNSRPPYVMMCFFSLIFCMIITGNYFRTERQALQYQFGKQNINSKSTQYQNIVIEQQQQSYQQLNQQLID